MKIASRFDEKYKYEKCPICLNICQNHLILSDKLWGCLKCGCAFVPKFIRKDLDIKALLDAQDFKCKICGKECKSALGLGSHMKSHKNDGGESKDD